MARPNIARYERAKKKRKWPPLKPTELAEAAGLPNTPEFQELVGDVDAAINRYDYERALAADATRDLLSGIENLRGRLHDALGAYHRIASRASISTRFSMG